MNGLRPKLTFEHLSHIPKRVHQDWHIASLIKNWREVLYSKLTGKPVRLIKFRSGLVLHSPPQVSLNFLFMRFGWIKFIVLQVMRLRKTIL